MRERERESEWEGSEGSGGCRLQAVAGAPWGDSCREPPVVGGPFFRRLQVAGLWPELRGSFGVPFRSLQGCRSVWPEPAGGPRGRGGLFGAIPVSHPQSPTQLATLLPRKSCRVAGSRVAGARVAELRAALWERRERATRNSTPGKVL